MSGEPIGGARAEDHARFAEWDAAYVLGALSPAERREFEAHLPECAECAGNVTGLAALPGLLSRVPRENGMALLEAGAGVMPEAEAEAEAEPVANAGARAVSGGRIGRDATGADVPASLLPRLELAARRERRRRRAGAWALAGAAAAAGVIGTLTIPQLLDEPGILTGPGPGESVVAELDPARGIPLTATVEFTSTDTGTHIDMTCSYPYGTGDGADRSYDLVVVDAAGEAERVSTWTSRSGSTVEIRTTIATPTSDIRAVQVRGTETGDVLLAAELD